MTPGGLWDSSKYAIKAMVKHENKRIETVDLTFAGPSTFHGEAVVTQKGDYEIIVYTFDPHTGNSGVDKAKVSVN